ncbi:MAG: hemolysin family protein [Planctomycetota bacterium]
MDPGLIVMLLVLPALLAASGFFSGTETALFSIGRHQQRQLERSKKVADAAAVRLLSETRPLLITLMLGNMVVNVSYFAVSTAALFRVQAMLAESGGGGASALWVGALTPVPLVAVILLGEVLPKIVAARLTLKWARVMSVPMLLVHRGVTPVRWVADKLAITPLARLLTPPEEARAFDASELASLLGLSRSKGVIDAAEQRLLRQVLELGRVRVREIMVPRVDVRAFDVNDPVEGLLALMRETRLRQIPVYDGELDRVLGVAYTKQVLLRPPADAEGLMKLVRGVKFVPEQQRADQLLTDLRKTGTTYAVVVDEYGGTAGLITLEDVVEFLVGDIPGEFEGEGEEGPEALEDGRFRVAGELSLRELPGGLGVGREVVEEAQERADTVGGWVMAELGRPAEAGELVRLGPVDALVEAVEGRRVETVVLVRVAEEQTGGEG